MSLKNNLIKKGFLVRISSSILKIFLTLVILFAFSVKFLNVMPVQAVAVTWNGAGTDGTCGGNAGDGNKWSCGANWSTGSAPASGDTITFNNTSTKNATIDASFQGTVASLTIASTYSGTITLARSFTVTGALSQSGGTLTASSQTLTIGGTLTINNSGATFNASTGTTLISGLSITAGSFFHNNGVVDFNGGANTLSCNGVAFNSVNFSGQTGVKTLNSCTFPVGASPTIPNGLTLNTSSLTGSGTITMTTGTLTLNSGTALTTFTGLTGTSNNLTVSTTFNMGSYNPATIGGIFTLNAGGTFTAPSGTLSVAGNFIINGGTFTHNSGTIDFTGSTASISCNGTGTSFNNVNFIGQTGGKTIGASSACSFNIGASPTIPNGITLTNGSILSGSGTLTTTTGTFTQQNGGSLSGFSGIVMNGGYTLGAASAGTASTTLDLSTYTTTTFNLDFIINTPTNPFTNNFIAPTGLMTVARTFTLNTGTGSTFNANGGTLKFTNNGSAVLTCDNATFNLVQLLPAGSGKTISSNCNLPLGSNPTIGLNTIYTLNGTLSGSGTLTVQGVSMAINTGASFSGFSSINFNDTTTTIGGTVNFSTMPSLTSITVNGAFTSSTGSSIVTLPTNSTFVGTLTVSAGTFTASCGTTTVKGALAISGTPTFNANGGAFDLSGGAASLACGGVTFNSVNFVGQTGTKTIGSDCSFPIGASPTISQPLILSGALTGSGTLLINTGTTLTMNSGASISTFSGLNVVGTLSVAGGTANLGSFTTFMGSGSFNLSSGTLTLPNNTDINGSLTISGGTFNAPSGSMSLAGALTISGTPTFNANEGTIVFDGGSSVLSCGNVTFFNTSINSTSTKTINANCTLPLGADPSVTRVALYGTLSGSGIIHFTSIVSDVFYTGYQLIGFSGETHAAVNTNTATITRLLGTDQGSYYQSISGVSGNASFMGVYNIKSAGGKIFMLWNSAIPDHEGTHTPVLASYDGSTFTKISTLTDDDDTRQKVFGNTLFIPGRDPSAGDDWDAGNLYTVNINTLVYTKWRYRYSTPHYVDFTTTDSNGNYSFNGLKKTSYALRFVTPPNYVLTTADYSDGLDNILDSNPSVSTGVYTQCAGIGAQMAGIDFLNPFTDDTIDAGYVSTPGATAGSPITGTLDSSYYSGTMNIGDHVWIDSNGNGKQDTGELGLAGVRVELFTKDPYFPCTIHSNGFTQDAQGNWYYSAGIGFFTTNIFSVPSLGYNIKGDQIANVVFKSSDNGTTWTPVQQDPTNYEDKDLTYSNGYFYQIFDSDNFTAFRNVSLDTLVNYSSDGQNWSDQLFKGNYITPNVDIYNLGGTSNNYNVTRKPVNNDNELTSFKGKIVTIAGDPTQIATLTNGNQLNFIQTNIDKLGEIIQGWNNIYYPGANNSITGGYSRYSTIVATGNDYLYVIGSDNKIYLTTDLHNYIPVADFSQVDAGSQLISLGYWNQNDQIVASTIGSDGNVYSIPQSQLIPKLIKITNPSSNLSFVDQYENVDMKNIGSTGSFPLSINDGSLRVVDVSTNLTGSCSDWSAVTAGSSADVGKSYVTNLNSISCNASTHNLYIPIPSGQVSNNVIICPSAKNYGDISYYCSGGVEFAENDTKNVGGVNVTATKTTIDGQNYWLASGVSGTGGESVIQDTAGPVGTMIINNGAKTTNSPTVNLTLAVSDNDPLSNIDMQISEDYVFAGATWEPFSASRIFTLSSGLGEKHLYVRFRDFSGNISLKYGAVITLNATGSDSSNPASYAVSYPVKGSNNEKDAVVKTVEAIISSNPNFILVICCLGILILLLIAFVLYRKKKKQQTKNIQNQY